MFLLQNTIMMLTGLGIIFFAYEIGIKKRIFLITGYSKKVKNVDKLSNSLGAALLILGLANVFAPWLIDSIGDKGWWIYSIIVFLTAVYAVVVYIKEA